MVTEEMKEVLYAAARTAGSLGDSMLRSFSGADQADSEAYYGERRVYVAIAGGTDIETAIAAEDARWRAYAAQQAAKVEAAPKLSRGSMRGQSVISHRWVDPEKFTTRAGHIRAMVKTLTERLATAPSTAVAVAVAA